MYEEDNSTVLNRMLNNVPSDIDKSEGSFVYDALTPASQEIVQQEVNLDEVLKKVFAQTAADNGYSTELDLRCAEHGITRKQGTKATGQVTFTGTDGTLIPSGTLIQTAGGLQYQTTADATIASGTTAVNIEATAIGSASNVPANTIIELPVQIVGVTSVTNSNATTGGTDIETDASLLARLFAKVQVPSTSGNKNDYKLWALDVPGVGDAKVFPLWNGNGTVKVCIIDSDKQPASSDIVTAVQTYIESARPIGATVTYEAATGLNINVSVTITKDSSYTTDQIITNITAKITDFLKSIAFNQNYVSYAKIGDAILSSEGVTDYSNLQVNSGTVNISVGDEQVAVIGTVTIS